MRAHTEVQASGGATWRLDVIAAELKGLRAISQKRRYRGRPLPEMPSREAVARIVEDFVGALYPRHFGPAALRPDAIEEYVGATIDRALRALLQQVRRELHLAEVVEGRARGELEGRAGEIVAAFAHDLPRIRALLDSDIRAAFDGDPAARSLDEVVFCYPGVAAIIRHRVAHSLYRLDAPLLARIIAELSHSQTGIDIHPGAEIGESFFIDHGTGVVIGETARIGKRVRLYQAVTLGAKRFEVDAAGAVVKGGPRHPIIEDEVVIYAGATVLGRVTIGRGASIGGGVWLTQSVAPGAIVTQAKARAESFDDGAGI
ncbi:MAG TPA: serine acetyltransferase [Rhodoblastus sp.]|nr:serine acetyltransferase [Rhodoblastus sp.]